MILPIEDAQEPIAIVGVGFRFAGGVSSMSSLWDIISKVKTAHGPVPSDRWSNDVWQHPDPDRKGGIVPSHGYFLDQDISHFDAPFFSVTAKEAASMDPMKRMLLEVCHESIENAGIPVETLINSRTGCYVGCMTNDYEMISLHDIYDVGHPAATGLSEAMTANRVSWFFGLKGPSLTLDTACSSSLYALHLACQSLRLKETNMSLVTGVNLMINPNTSHQLSAMHMLSPDGISHTFDDRANGYGRGDGIGSLVVKRLSDALRDGDTVRAVIRGSGVNSDGKTPSVTQPSASAQADLIIQTYEDAGLDPSQTGYFECHGTGTPVGDPLELNAIAKTLGAARRETRKSPLPIGSIKPTVGHTEGCAGLAGVFKSILLLEKGMLVPTYGVERVNPQLKLSEWHLSLPQEVTIWPAQTIRRISVNSFGFGGANAHVILDDAFHYFQDRGLVGKHNVQIHPDSDSAISVRQPSEISNDTSPKLVLLSGKDQIGAKRMSEDLATWLTGVDEDALSDLAYTLSMRRTHMEHRTFVTASSVQELSEVLLAGLPMTTRSQRCGDNIVMIFTGQGAQWPAMGLELYGHPAFRQSIEASQSYLESFGCTWNALDELTKTTNNNINLPEYSQPLCTVVQVALVDLLRSWKVRPIATIGHSSGEIAAAYAALLLSHRDAIKIAYVRGISSAAVLKRGAMMAVGLSEHDAQTYLGKVAPESVAIACVNSPSSVTLSGDVEAIDNLESILTADGKFARKLKVTTAYHSPHMRDVSQGYLETIGDITPEEMDALTDTDKRPVMYSSLTGSIITSASQLNAKYWVGNMESPVLFSQALSALLKHKSIASRVSRPSPVQWGNFLEVGPHCALKGPVRQIIDASSNKFARSAPYTSILIRGKDAAKSSRNAIGQLWAAGANIDLAAVNDLQHDSGTFQMLCDLPTYPWNHTRSYWHESYSSHAYRFPKEARSDFLGIAEDPQNTHEPRWRNYLRIAENPWIEDHAITGTVLYPGAGVLVMALEGALRTADLKRTVEGFRMTNVTFERGLVISLDDEAPVETRLSLYPHSSAESWLFAVYSMSKGSPWTKNCAGTISLVYEKGSSEVEEGPASASWVQIVAGREALLADPASSAVNVDNFYNHLEDIGMQYGPTFRNVVSLTAVPERKASYGTVTVPDTKSTMPSQHESPHVIHPATLDSIFHLVIASVDAGLPRQSAVPYAIEDLYIARDQPQGSDALYSGYGHVVSQHDHEIKTELYVSDPSWKKPMITIKSFALRQVTSEVDLDPTEAGLSISATKNCAGITWCPDLSFLTNHEDITELFSVSDKGRITSVGPVLDSVCLQKPDSTILVALGGERLPNFDIVRDLTNRQSILGKIVIWTSSSSVLDVIKTTLGEGNERTTVIYKLISKDALPDSPALDTPDLVLGFEVSSLVESMISLVSMSPLVCLIHNNPQDQSLSTSMPCVAHCTKGGDHIMLFSRGDDTTKLLSQLPSSVVLLLPETPSVALLALVASIDDRITSFGMTVEHRKLTFEDIASSNAKVVISLLEIDGPLVHAWNKEQFEAFKRLISTVDHLFWITHGSVLESWSNGSEYAASQGLLRVMRNEYPAAMLPSLDLSATADISSELYTELITNVWRRSLAEDSETEYAERHRLIYVARATEDTSFDAELDLANGRAAPIWSTLGASGKPLKIAGSMDGPRGCVWIEDEEANGPLADGQVEVKIEYAGLRDIEGASSFQHAVGVVTCLPNSATSLQIGQQVIVFSQNTGRTHIRQTEAFVAPLPSNLQPQEAVALVQPLFIAQYALVERARLRRGQSLLIDGGASTVSQALVQVAKNIGVDVYVLVYNRIEHDILVSEYGIPVCHIFDSAQDNFVVHIRQATKGRGVDAFVSQQSGLHTSIALSILDDFGQFVQINGDSTPFPNTVSNSNTTFSYINAASLHQSRSRLVSQIFKQAFSNHTLQPPCHLCVIPITDVTSMVTDLRDEEIVVSLFDTTPVLVPQPRPDALKLDGTATYVLAGGLGALGLETANWMIECGAKNLVFLSRSRSKHAEALKLFAERSVRAEAFVCDVNDARSVAESFATIRSSGRRIAGVLQLAMVLQDSIFESMTYEQWDRAIEPKTKGSRNLLANLWPDDMPFFILLSSITGVIGNTAQANYASGNTFEDALAHHARAHLGINATSIDVGLVSDSAHFTGSGGFGELSSYLSRYQHGWRGLQTNLEDLGVVMRAIMRGSTADGKALPAQVILGLGDQIQHDENVGGFSRDKRLSLRIVQVDAPNEDSETKATIGALLANATTMTEATAFVEENIKELVATAMGIPSVDIDAQKPLYDYGVDSLQAVEIRNRALKNMKSEISVFEILSATPLGDVAAKIASKSQLVSIGIVQDG